MQGHLRDALHKFWREKNQAFEHSISNSEEVLEVPGMMNHVTNKLN